MRELSWRERGTLWIRLSLRILLLILALSALRYLIPPLLRLFMPFALALLVAWILNPVVRTLQKRLGLSRGFSSLLLILLAFAGVGASLFGLGYSLVSEVQSLGDNWSSLQSSIQAGLQALIGELDRLLAYLPAGTRQVLEENLDKIWSWLSAWTNSSMVWAGTRAKDFAFSIPSFVVALIVFVLGTYFITSDYPHLRFLVTERMPRSLRDFLSRIKHTALGAFAGYLRAQLIISVGVFAILLAGFFLMKQGYALLLALVLAILDFIPLIGSGTVMVPWAVVDLITGDWPHAAGLMAVWGSVCVFRRVAEPKAVGSQTGLSPILSLVSMYVGMKLAGVVGMILGPVFCLVAINILRCGIFDGLTADLKQAIGDLAAFLQSPPPGDGPGRPGPS